MSKPWLETWKASEDGEDVVTASKKHGYLVCVARETEDVSGFISAAPDMCRALLAVEWAAVEWAGTCNSHEVMCYEPHAICPKCGGADPHESFVHPDEAGHHHDCTFDAALTKAGLATQEQRAAARKELGI